MDTLVKRFRIILFATIIWMFVMRLYSPPNVVQFEFAGTVQSATQIISDWGPEGVSLAKTGTYLDFIFLILYCASISVACLVAANFSKSQVLIKVGLVVFWIVWLAGVCDAIENIAMLQTLNEINQTTISIAWNFAAVKFGIVVLGLLFIITAYITGLVKKMA